MNFKTLLKNLTRLGFPKDQFVIVGSGPLGVRNLRESKDLDILVSDQFWNQIMQKYPIKNEYGIDKIEVGKDIEILGEGSAFRDSDVASTNEIIETADVIDGIRYINLDLLKKFKKKMGRAKDIQDIELINQYLSNK